MKTASEDMVIHAKIEPWQKQYIKQHGSVTEFIREAIRERQAKENDEFLMLDVQKYPDWLYEKMSTEKRLYNLLLSLSDDPKKEDITRSLFDAYNDPTPFYPMMDKRSPFYIDYVETALADCINIKKTQTDINALKMKQTALLTELELLKQEITETEKDLAELSADIPSMRKEKETLTRAIDNLRVDRGIEMVTKYIHSVNDVVGAILKGGSMVEMQARVRSVSPEQVAGLSTLLELSNTLDAYLKTEEFLSQKFLDEEKAKLQKEIEEAKKSLKLVGENNLWKNHAKDKADLKNIMGIYSNASPNMTINGRQLLTLMKMIEEVVIRMEKEETIISKAKNILNT